MLKSTALAVSVFLTMSVPALAHDCLKPKITETAAIAKALHHPKVQEGIRETKVLHGKNMAEIQLDVVTSSADKDIITVIVVLGHRDMLSQRENAVFVVEVDKCSGAIKNFQVPKYHMVK